MSEFEARQKVSKTKFLMRYAAFSFFPFFFIFFWGAQQIGSAAYLTLPVPPFVSPRLRPYLSYLGKYALDEAKKKKKTLISTFHFHFHFPIFTSFIFSAPFRRKDIRPSISLSLSPVEKTPVLPGTKDLKLPNCDSRATCRSRILSIVCAFIQHRSTAS